MGSTDNFHAAVDVDAVTTLIHDVCERLVLPRFSQLEREDIQAKATAGDPEDIVTIVDHEVEERLSLALTKMVPSAAVIGEEAAHCRPELFHLLASDAPVWVIDPIDGTKNFARGDDRFGIMVAWVVSGNVQAAWIVLPARKQTLVAEVGSGAYLNGVRIRVPCHALEAAPRGALIDRYIPAPSRPIVNEAMRGRFRAVPPAGCAAMEYTSIVRGETEFVIYYRLLPWDHAAPACILSEAGGRVSHLDGSAYTVRSANRLTVVARDAAISNQIQAWLQPHVGLSL